jgi:RimJ/RimL family protein N-acetyltransferase
MITRPPFEPFPTLASATVLLRACSERDLDAWFQRASDPGSSDVSGDPIPASRDTVAEWLELHRRRYAAGEDIRWAIVPAGADGSVGSIGLSRLDESTGSAELGAVVGRAHWGGGLGTAAARLVVRFAFDVLNVGEVRADCLQRNAASMRVLEKLGFERVGDVDDYLHGEPGALFALERR